jgi:hypothetical protein
VTAGGLLAGAAPLMLLKAGVVAMAAIDAVVIFGDLFDRENALFDAAAPAVGLPRLQVAELGDASTDYGDFFVAGLVGGILAAEHRPPAHCGNRHVRRHAGVQPALPRRRFAAGRDPAGARDARVQSGTTRAEGDEMSFQRPAETQPWMHFALPAAIAVPIIAGFMLGGPIVGFLVAPLVAIVIVGVAIGMEPRSSRATAAAAAIGSDGERGSPECNDARRWRRAAALRFLVPVAIAAAGVVLIASGSRTISIIGWGTFAVAATVAISLVFLEIGYSEDRARRSADEPHGR